MPTPCVYSSQHWKEETKGAFCGCQVDYVMSVKQTWPSFPQISQLSQSVQSVLPHGAKASIYSVILCGHINSHFESTITTLRHCTSNVPSKLLASAIPSCSRVLRQTMQKLNIYKICSVPQDTSVSDGCERARELLGCI